MKIVSILSFLLLLIPTISGQEKTSTAATEGKLLVTATTSKTSNAEYAPSNIVAVYILDSQGKFVKTLLAYASERRQYLVNWKNVTTIAGAAYNTVDAITGATQKSHAARTCSWNGKNRSGVTVEDGAYTLRMELTDNDGIVQNLASFSFTKGATPVTLTPSTTNGFSNISIQWQPVNTALEASPDDKSTLLASNKVTTTLTIRESKMQQFEIYDLNGKKVLSGRSMTTNIEHLPAGTYMVKITTNELTSYRERFLKH